MTACSDNSATGVLTQLIISEASNSSSDERDDEGDTISIISSTSTVSLSISEAQDGDSSSATSRKDPSLLLSVLQQAKTSDLSRKRIICNNLLPKENK